MSRQRAEGIDALEFRAKGEPGQTKVMDALCLARREAARDPGETPPSVGQGAAYLRALTAGGTLCGTVRNANGTPRPGDVLFMRDRRAVSDLDGRYVISHLCAGEHVLYWNNDTTRLSACLHADFLDLIDSNPFVNAGPLDVRGMQLDINPDWVNFNSYDVGPDHVAHGNGLYGATGADRYLHPDGRDFIAMFVRWTVVAGATAKLGAPPLAAHVKVK